MVLNEAALLVSGRAFFLDVVMVVVLSRLTGGGPFVQRAQASVWCDEYYTVEAQNCKS